MEIGDSDTLHLLDPLVICDYVRQSDQDLEQLMRVPVMMSEGMVTAFETADGQRRAWIWVDVATNPGSMGGIAVDQEGMIVGIVGDMPAIDNAPGLARYVRSTWHANC